ncbi:reverse transcriptase domain-containing protein [Tanacetum coccineum]
MKTTHPQQTHQLQLVTDAQLKAMIDQGVTAILAARDADRSRNGDDNHTSGTGTRRTERVARECTYQDFMKCQPLYFKGTEECRSVYWFEWMNTIVLFKQLNYGKPNQVCHMYSSWNALNPPHPTPPPWWNSHVRTVGHDVAYEMTWTDLKNKMTTKYCPRGEIKKLEVELWNLKVKGTDVMLKPNVSRIWHLMCVKDVSEDNVAQAYAVRTGERKEYAKTLPLCNKCKFHHNGPCTAKCANCKKVGHLTRDCWNPTATRNQRTITCYECGDQGHYRSDWPELKNQNHGNQARGTGTRRVVHALGGGEIDSQT